MREEIVARTPLARLVTPDEVAAAIPFPASDAAAAVRGCGLVVDGGLDRRVDRSGDRKNFLRKVSGNGN
jgi:NAD(P)-dependent dehydrogenase (short-subunit alcohol dehydrogenase family)